MGANQLNHKAFTFPSKPRNIKAQPKREKERNEEENIQNPFPSKFVLHFDLFEIIIESKTQMGFLGLHQNL